MEAEKENVLWNWTAENKRRGKRWGTEARGRQRSSVAWGGTEQMSRQAVIEWSCSQKMA